MELWLSSIASFSRRDANEKVLVPPIIIVGSHLDCIKVSKDKKGYKLHLILYTGNCYIIQAEVELLYIPNPKNYKVVDCSAVVIHCIL